MKYTIYHLVANQGGRYTKHIYIGGERVVSKIGDFASYGPDPRRIEYAGSEADAVTVDYNVKYSQQLQAIKDNYATFGVPYNGSDKITPETDFTMLKDGLNNHNVFIGACDIGTLEGRGYELVENMAKQTSSLVVASDHPIRAGYKYDGSNYLNNDDIKIPFKPTSPQNEFIYSNRGEPFGFIKNVTIDKNKGMSWSFDINNSFKMNLFAK